MPSPTPLIVCIFPEPAPNRPRTVQYPHYIKEILSHAGVCHTIVTLADLPAHLNSAQLLLTVGEATLTDDLKSALRTFVSRGGGWISLAGTCEMDDLLGVSPAPAYSGFGAGNRTLGEGYLTPTAACGLASRSAPSPHPATAHLPKPLHFFNGFAMKSTGATILATALDAHGRAKDEPVLFEHSHGAGKTLTLSIDLPGTVVLVQQGFSVTRDGIPAPDGTAPVTDGVLKSGDGAVLDWLFDRDEVPGASGFNAYLHPVADLWRELLLRCIFHLASELNVALPVLWYWPRNLPAVAHMSHDTDGNEVAHCRKLLDLLKQADITTTWCVILPGYTPDLMNAIRSAGHEFATHYDAMTEGLDWCKPQFDRQITELKKLFADGHPSAEQPVTNKNHYLRWEGDMEFFDWCHQHGLQLDQSKGASKTGEAGFNFGTCHLYFPVRFNGQSVDVLEMATPTQDLEVFAPYSLCEPLLDSVIAHHGIFHLLFHPAHMLKDLPAHSLLKAAALAKSKRLEWWTARDLNSWERARRQITWNGVAIESSIELKDATILILIPTARGLISNTVNRWGFTFSMTTTTLHVK